MAPALSAQSLEIDAAAVSAAIEKGIRTALRETLRRRGAVVGLSGGVDSSVVAALCVRAAGADRVIGLLMPEAESSANSLRLGGAIADRLGIRTYVEDITAMLHAADCYRRRDEAIRSVVPDFTDGWRCKIVMPDLVERDGYPIFSAIVASPSGDRQSVRLTADAYLGIVAATNFKQRVRKMMEYHYADRFHFAVAGTPNLLEYDQGFFVKNGDGAADLKPIAHLYKSQVYQLAAYLEVPLEICRRAPTTDTYSLPQTQEEFYFGLSLGKTDLCLFARNHGLAPEEAAGAVGLTPEQVRRVYRMIDAKRDATRYLHMAPVRFGDE